MIEVDIPKDTSKYKPKFILGLTLRETICVGIAAIVAVPTFLILDKIFIRSFVLFVSMFLATPALLCGFFHPYDMEFEKYAKIVLESIFIRPKKRKYITENTFEIIYNAFEDEIDLEQKEKYANVPKKNYTPKNKKRKNVQVSSDPELMCCD